MPEITVKTSVSVAQKIENVTQASDFAWKVKVVKTELGEGSSATVRLEAADPKDFFYLGLWVGYKEILEKTE